MTRLPGSPGGRFARTCSRRDTIAELRQLGRELLDKRVYFFLSDQAPEIYEALPDAR